MSVEKILRRPEVQEASGYKTSQLYAKIAAGEFPKPIKIGERAVGWIESEVAEWQKQRIARRDRRAKS
jgi:prophage regulatory protein